MITYEEAEQYILGIPGFARKHTLEDTRRLLQKIAGDIGGSKIIHVAGTNGKGSVCAYLRSILMESGRSVGMFISPHLETMRERISFNKELISREEFVRVFERVREALPEASEQHPSFFEFLFLMAMLYFREKEPEYIILETGLGGRLDATNSVEKPELCVITEIGYDHMQYLGDTLAQIAGEKAGIIKEGVPLVFADRGGEASRVLRQRTQEKGILSIAVGKDNISAVNIGNKTIDFSLHTGYYNYVSLFLNTTAVYQVENASLAVCAAGLLAERDARICEETVRRGVERAVWPGRMEEALPGVYLDGAHNEDGIEAFLSSVKNTDCGGRRLLLFGVVSDKRYESMAKRIADAGLFRRAAVTVLESDRSVSYNRLQEVWGQYDQINCSFHESAEEAFRCLLSDREEADIIYIAGSLYLIGQLKALIRRMPDD
ncbi:MAG: bifunctional folylpolyglutamate synthase/dihydrofolate synthase [Lachnospiraceae bacterium]|nr:bifunctional folylpolyglutamate synthase/dihydrofolate synthase [Lachnospiraceae bacterium]MDE6815732.1 bifunctional folylpolyglutamate synthase/dihydrofolate synthase [Lachnospiraceae bacterium]